MVLNQLRTKFSKIRMNYTFPKEKEKKMFCLHLADHDFFSPYFLVAEKFCDWWRRKIHTVTLFFILISQMFAMFTQLEAQTYPKSFLLVGINEFCFAFRTRIFVQKGIYPAPYSIILFCNSVNKLLSKVYSWLICRSLQCKNFYLQIRGTCKLLQQEVWFWYNWLLCFFFSQYFLSD